MSIWPTVGELIKTAREEKQLTYRDLAKKISSIAGPITVPYIENLVSRLERGRFLPSIHSTNSISFLIARTLDIDIKYLKLVIYIQQGDILFSNSSENIKKRWEVVKAVLNTSHDLDNILWRLMV